MSKKIRISYPNISSRLVDLFHSFLSNRVNLRHSFYDDMEDEEIAFWKSQGFLFDDEDDEDYNEDDVSVIWPPTNRNKGNRKKDAYDVFWESQRSKKKHKRGKRGSKARTIDISTPYSGDELDPREIGDGDYTDYVEIDDNGITNGKTIYYYPDYHDKDNRLEFNTLSGFSEFCEENGYIVSDTVANDIMFRRVSHCCLCPMSREYGMYEIMSEDSYGTMFYEVCEANELG